MADKGRSRGRARGKASSIESPEDDSAFDLRHFQQTLPQMTPSTAHSIPTLGTGGDNSDNGNNGRGNGNGAAVRGRAGYRAKGPPINTRPIGLPTKQGTGGKTVDVLSNYFELRTPENAIVYDYHIDFEPDIDSRIVRKGLLYNQSVREAFNDRLMFDGMSNIKSTVLLPSEETNFFATRTVDQTQVRIRIRRVGEIGWGHNEMFRLYNTQMRKNFHLLHWNLIGRYFFNPNIRHNLPQHRLEVLQGLLTAINRHDGGRILMVADTIHKIIRTDTVLENLRQIYRRDSNAFNANSRKELTGSIVITSYNNKTYRVDDIAFDKNPRTTFDKKGTNISFVDYYRQQYNITITDLTQPLLIAIPSIREQRAGLPTQILLVPELCNMTGISDSMANDFSVRKELTQLTQENPKNRVNYLSQFITSLNSNQEIRQDMNRWGLEFDRNLVSVRARVLDCEPVLTYNQTIRTATPWVQSSGDFSKEIRGKQMFVSVNIKNWVIIASKRDQNIVGDFAQTLKRVCEPMGVTLSPPQIKIIENDRTSTFVEASKLVPPSVQIIVAILPNNNKDRYDAIKKIFCCEHPMASQLVVSRTLAKRQQMMSVCTKIGIQMACKLDAEPWILDIPPKNLMVVGFDVHRDSAQRERAIGAFVCSTNPTLTKWYSCVSPHKNREELSSNFRNNFQLGLKRYFEINKTPPQVIVIYRDGVSEGDIEYVFNFELKQIEDAIKSLFNALPIKLCFIIVTKRINTRFFQRVANNQYNNPIPGTVVDSVVTRDERYDFYLISQSVRQGTVTPTMYNIIKDDTKWAPQRHQQLAFKLCHLYYNWIGTVRVPAPCQYAHKLAYLTGTSLHRPFHTNLSGSLFYL